MLWAAWHRLEWILWRVSSPTKLWAAESYSDEASSELVGTQIPNLQVKPFIRCILPIKHCNETLPGKLVFLIFNGTVNMEKPSIERGHVHCHVWLLEGPRWSHGIWRGRPSVASCFTTGCVSQICLLVDPRSKKNRLWGPCWCYGQWSKVACPSHRNPKILGQVARFGCTFLGTLLFIPLDVLLHETWRLRMGPFYLGEEISRVFWMLEVSIHIQI